MERATLAAEPDQVADWLRHGMAELLASREVRPMPGAVELASEVRAAGVPCALVTSSEPIIADAVLAALAPSGVRFDVVVTGGDVTTPKPDPEPYLLASDKLGADPRCCVALEDSPNGVRSARAAGCVTVAVPGLAPITDANGVHVVGSLTAINLDALRGLIASR
jgi:HAD superfamily hydrolase (TIGR01509 family)